MSKIEDLKQIIEKMNTKIDSLTQAINNQSADQQNVYHSCDDLLAKQPSSPSGYYLLADSHGRVRHVYCHMENLCNSGGGWMRVAHLNMTNSSEKCPEQFSTYSSGSVRGCGRPYSSGGSCAGITFLLRDFKYTKVCGKVIGYQFGVPDGFNTGSSNIESVYVDGVSITHGSNPRKHIWTLATGAQDRHSYNTCPCGSTPSTSPSFVGSDYYCEAGNHDQSTVYGRFYNSDRLWDGKECGNHETACCQRTLIPWFLKSFSYSTTDYIEMRICNSQDTHDENAPVEQYEIYIK
jgi:dynein heavy chain